jgi:hypothetical protein
LVFCDCGQEFHEDIATFVEATVPVKDMVLGGLSALAANLCPFSGRREVARFGDDFGEPVGEAVEATTAGGLQRSWPA